MKILLHIVILFSLLLGVGVMSRSRTNAATQGTQISPATTKKPGTVIAPTLPPLVGQQYLGGARVSDAAARRLRAAGLDPSSTEFSTQLHARLVRNAAIPAGPVVKSTPYLSDALRQRLSASSGSIPNTSGAAARTVPRTPRALTQHLITSWGRLTDWTSYQPAKVPLIMPWLYWLPLKEPDPAAHTGPYPGSVRVTVPDCGVDAIHVAKIVRANDLPGSEYGSLLATNPGVDFSGWSFAQFFFLSDLINGEFPLGAQQHAGNITLTVDSASDTMSLPLAALVVQTSYPITVSSEPPFLAANALGVGPSNSSFAQPTVTRVNLGSDTITGTDIIAIGMELGPGYTASATVISAQSIADLGGDASPNNGYRGAVVVTQPTAHRLQTVVQWHIGPGDSLQYYLRWTFTGPEGQRALMNLSKNGVCDT